MGATIVCSTVVCAQSTAVTGTVPAPTAEPTAVLREPGIPQSTTVSQDQAIALQRKREAEAYIRQVKGENAYITVEERRRLYQEFDKKKAEAEKDKEGG